MIERKEPWLTEKANQILEQILNDYPCKVNVLEFGSGASTIYFAKHPKIKKLVSIEHEPDWFIRVHKELNGQGNVDMYLLPQPYNNVCEEFKDETFDIILVDGRDRVKCIESCLPKLKYGGVLILDNSERENYQYAIDLMSEFPRTVTTQEEPDKYSFTYPGWSTTLFYKDI